MFVQNRENKLLLLNIKIGRSGRFTAVTEASQRIHVAFVQT